MGRLKTPWSQARIALAAYARGASLTEAGKSAGISCMTVSRLVEEHGVVMLSEHKQRLDALTLEEREEIRVGIENRESFEQLRDVLGDRPVDIPMMVRYGSYPRYRLLVTFFLERKGWSVDQLLHTRLTAEQANEIMRADAKP